ncbi:MAG: response regulator [Actinobacteria bacterium]|nr:response regulator [Actinomycetota bacterium]
MNKRVLVVDDDQSIQRVLVQTLELEGYEVATASDGVEALETLAGQLPDVVILDVMMPKLDGLDVLKRMRADERTQTVPVILLTARSSQEDIWEGWQSGVDYYMTKPFDVEELLRFLSHVLNPQAEPD